MNIIFALIKIVRPGNALMTGAAVLLGSWLARSAAPLVSLFLLVAAAMSAVGFGNVINDIVDIETDRVSHPDRPLPKTRTVVQRSDGLRVFLRMFFTCKRFSSFRRSTESPRLFRSLFCVSTHFFSSQCPW